MATVTKSALFALLHQFVAFSEEAWVCVFDDAFSTVCLDGSISLDANTSHILKNNLVFPQRHREIFCWLSTWILRCCRPRQYFETLSTPLSVTRVQLFTLNFLRFGQFSDKSFSPRSETSHFPMSSDRSLEQDRETHSTAESETC